MGDYIDRQAALDALGEKPFASVPWGDEHELGMYRQYEKDKALIEAVPPADVEPVRHGRWERASYDEAICSECGFDGWTGFLSSQEADEKWRYLPPYCERCGAKMDGEQDG